MSTNDRMMTFPTTIRRFGLVAGIFAFLTCGTGVSTDEITCELAAAHLEECCPRALIECRYISNNGCGFVNERYPVSSEQSHCILDLSCAEIQERDICRTIIRGRRVSSAYDYYYGDGVIDTPETVVCP